MKQPAFLFFNTLFLISFLSFTLRSQEKLDLFIWAGQSNAQGWMGDAAYYPEEMRELDDSVLLNWTFVDNESSGGKWVTMQPQAGRFTQGHFGPEVSFGRELKKAGYNPAIFKYTKGATGLASDWKAPGEAGIYDRMTGDLKFAIQKLEEQGFKVTVRGFIWIQGETDAGDEQTANAYYHNLKLLINDLRNNLLHIPNLNIILGVDEKHPFVIERPLVVEAQRRLAEEDSTILFTSMLGLPKADATHLTPAGLVEHGNRIFEAYLKLLSDSSGKDPGRDTLKVITYNIWNGFDWGKDTVRRKKLQQWMKIQQPSVFALQELCAYTPEKLEEDAKSWGHNYSVLLKTTGYSVGLTSEFPIHLKEKILDGMHHGALHCQTAGIDYLVVHFHPGSIKRRREEAEILLRKLEKIENENSRYIVLGDFNAHSPFDADLYDSDGYFMKRLRNQNAYKELDGNVFLNDLDYSVMASFLGFPLYDVIRNYTTGINERGSFPGRVLEIVNNETTEQLVSRLERIDYILVSPELKKQCIGARVYNGKENWFLSDHYPVQAKFILN
jgi:endonuclease/exonuclease/phosphatase family metal-dependent hydrolase